MDILAVLRRAEDKYRRTHKTRPLRIVLKGDAAEQFADMLTKRLPFDAARPTQTPEDEAFLAGRPVFYKGIPVIAALNHYEELVITDEDLE